MRGIYLGAFQAEHPSHSICYQDINGLRDISGDMLDIDLSKFDFVVATPPCNYWSRANWRRDTSPYSLKTRHLLPCILLKLISLDKPFIVENVRNDPLFDKWGLLKLPVHIYHIGEHTYWSNILMPSDIEQKFANKHFISSKQRQGGENVHNVIEIFLNCIDA